MHAERMSYGPGYTEIMTGRLNLFMMLLNTSFLTQELEIEAKEIVLEMRAYVAFSEHLRSEPADPPWLESLHEILHENCCDPIHLSDLANEAGGQPASRPSNPLSCSGRIS
jgi:hypothetical protein